MQVATQARRAALEQLGLIHPIKVAGRKRFSGGSPFMTRDGFFNGGQGATSSEWISHSDSVGFVGLEQLLKGDSRSTRQIAITARGC